MFPWVLGHKRGSDVKKDDITEFGAYTSYDV